MLAGWYGTGSRGHVAGTLCIKALAAIERAEFVHFTFRIVVAKFSECQDRRKNICSPEPMKAPFRCSALGHF
jgi:hypothetical protein